MCSGFGFLLGIFAVGALLKVASCAWRRRWYAYEGHGGGYGGRCGGRSHRHAWGHHHPRWYDDDRNDRDDRDDREYGEGERVGDRDFGFGFGKRFILRFLFERLDTTPGQEKVVAQAFDEIRESLKAAKVDWTSSRSRMADAMRGADFDHEAVGDAWAKHDAAFEAMRLKIATSMQHVHEALDERQRKILADLIEKGGPFGRWARG